MGIQLFFIIFLKLFPMCLCKQSELTGSCTENPLLSVAFHGLYVSHRDTFHLGNVE